MAKTFGGALSMALSMLMLKLASPEVADLVSQIIVNALTVIAKALEMQTGQKFMDM